MVQLIVVLQGVFIDCHVESSCLIHWIVGESLMRTERLFTAEAVSGLRMRYGSNKRRLKPKNRYIVYCSKALFCKVPFMLCRFMTLNHYLALPNLQLWYHVYDLFQTTASFVFHRTGTPKRFNCCSFCLHVCFCKGVVVFFHYLYFLPVPREGKLCFEIAARKLILYCCCWRAVALYFRIHNVAMVPVNLIWFGQTHP